MKTHLTLFFALILTYCTTPLNAQNLPDYLPADGLVGWWPFNGNANDESGNGNNGLISGPSLTTDRFSAESSCYNFDFNGMAWNSELHQVIDIPYSPQFNSSALSVSVWFNARNYYFPGIPGTDKQSAIITRYQGGYSNPNGQSWGIFLREGMLYCFISTPSNQIYQDGILLTPSAQLNQWQHVIMTFDNQYFSVYLNGSLVDQQASTVTINNLGTSGISVGCSNQANGYWYEADAKIDDIAIYNRALTFGEVQAIYNSAPTDFSINESSITVPAFINYQAVARSANGDALANADVQVRFTLLADSLGGATEYSETHALTTNALGLFTTAFGSGTPEVSTFDSIAWDNSIKFLRVELNAGNGYIDMGTQQLLSVPFALRSQSAAAIRNESLPVFSDNAAAVDAGLAPGTMYRTSSGVLMVVY